MNIFKFELRQNRKSIITWSAALAVFVFIVMMATPMFMDSRGEMKKLLMGFPEAARNAMNINIDTFFSYGAVGFYSYIFLYLGLISGIFAMYSGLNVFSKEKRMKTSDFLMSKPKNRAGIYRQKLLSVLVSFAVVDAVFFIASYVSILLVSGGDLRITPYLLISFTFIFLQIIFLSIGIFIASVVSKIKSPVTFTMGVTFGTFLIGMIGAIIGMAGKSQVLRYFSPFRYFDNNYIMENNSYELKFIIISAVIVTVLMAASFFIYVKRDIKAC